MAYKVIAKLNPDLIDQLRSNNLEYQYSYTEHYTGNHPRSLSIRVECAAISLSDLETLLPWGHFVVCPVNHETLELYTSLPAEIEKCII